MCLIWSSWDLPILNAQIESDRSSVEPDRDLQPICWFSRAETFMLWMMSQQQYFLVWWARSQGVTMSYHLRRKAAFLFIICLWFFHFDAGHMMVGRFGSAPRLRDIYWFWFRTAKNIPEAWFLSVSWERLSCNWIQWELRKPFQEICSAWLKKNETPTSPVWSDPDWFVARQASVGRLEVPDDRPPDSGARKKSGDYRWLSLENQH